MTEEDAERATQYLVDTAYKYGEAKANAEKSQLMLKHIKALAMKASPEGSAAAQEREAYASDEYVQGVEEVFRHVFEAEKLKAAREAASIRVDFWRSVNARQRGA